MAIRVDDVLHQAMSNTNDILDACDRADGNHYAEITLELFLLGSLECSDFFLPLKETGGDIGKLRGSLESALSGEPRSTGPVHMSGELEDAMSTSTIIASGRHSDRVLFADLIYVMIARFPDVRYYLQESGADLDKFIEKLYSNFKLKPPVAERVSFNGTPGQTEQEKPSFLKQFATDMIEQAKATKEPLVGRESELDKTIRILCRKTKPNVIHVGEPGVGKTAIILGLAKRILDGDVPAKMQGYEVYSLDTSALIAGARFRGDTEERVNGVLKELSEKEKVLVYIDEIHTLVGSGSVNGSGMDLGGLLKTALTSSNIRFIGSTTYEEYRKHFEQDKALSRRFKMVEILEPSVSDTKSIIRGILPYYEEYHSVKYTDDAIDAAIDLTVKYMHERYLPDKAIDIIDEAGAQFSKDGKAGQTVNASVIEKIVSETCRVPIETVSTDDSKKLLTLADSIKKKVFGQDEAIDACVQAIKLSRSGLQDEGKPMANLLFVGQTGVGKTEIARQLAAHMGIDLVRFDMSEYADETSVNKLIGASAGYVGYDDGGLLVEQIRKHPHAVLLLDEIEKAHPKVFNILLQVMDNAELTDNKGRKADFKNVILIMTSNAGASGVVSNGLGFGAASKVIDMGNMKRAVERTFTPEFRNRLTSVILLNSLNDVMAEKIVSARMKDLTSLFASKGIKVTYGDKVLAYLKEKGITEEYGARELLRVINSDIKLLFVDDMLVGTIKDGSTVRIRMKDEKPVIAIEQ